MVRIPPQTTIFDKIEEQKSAAIERVYSHADTVWKRAAADKLFEVAEEHKTFTSDDVLIPLEKAGILTGDNRAISAILLAAGRMHLITATDRFVNCRRPSRHHAPIRVWESRVYKAPAL